ncbi:putative bzip transcription factor protein [Lasiodiplodia theobromae]|nr:putative bzip transcription factor protein [Lasiodiplodia theobromae]
MPAYQQRPLFRPIQVGPSPPQLSSQSSDNTPSPTTTTPKLGSKRGRITAIACVPCKKRKSKCNGLQPVCNTCAIKGSTCSYDMRQEHRWQGTLRVNVKKLEQELEEVKSVLPLLATSSQREAATRLAIEIQNNGFSEHSADEMRKILEGPRTIRPEPDDAAPAVGSSSSSSIGGDQKSDVTATAASPESMPAYYAGYEQNVSPGFTQGLPTTTEAQWSAHPLLTTGDSGVWMPDGTFSPPHVQTSPYREGSTAPAVLSHGNKQDILGPSASSIPIAPHPINHPSMNFQSALAHGSSINPVTYTYATFRERKRQEQADGEPDMKVFGDRENDIRGLLNGETEFSNEQPLSVWAPRVANVFFNHVGIPEKLAACEVLKEVMAWQICPSRQNLERLPEWARPTQFQQVMPHDPTIDFLPWPSVRDFFLHNTDQHVAGVLVNHLSLNWPHEDSHTVYCEPSSGKLALSVAFREHISNLSNWTLAPELFEQMPFLLGKVRATGMH